jgi:pimeloyl-ACP methyl ester carboxylesterase
VRLRLFHAADGTRVAYREQGTGPGLVLLHSLGLTHREWAPVAEFLDHRFRVVLPDLPAHGDSEDRPHHPYTVEWLAATMAAFCVEVAGARPIVGGHGLGAELLLRAVAAGSLRPAKLVLAPNRLHRPVGAPKARAAWRAAARLGAAPGVDRLAGRAAQLAFRPERGMALTARGVPEARDLVRHATADIAGNTNLGRSWAKLARNLPGEPWRDLLDVLPRLDVPVLLLWADEDPWHPLQGAEEALDLLPDAQLRVLPQTGFLMTLDDPAGVARELNAFCA